MAKMRNNPLLAEVSKRVVQTLFEKIADEFEGKTVLEKWWDDGSATIVLKVDGDDRHLEFRLRSRPNDSGIHLVTIFEGGLEINVTPFPSVILAIVTR